MSLEKELRIGVLDIETTGLFADYAYILSYYVKTLGEDEAYGRSLTRKEILNFTFDKNLCLELVKNINRYDYIITFDGELFDRKFIQTRCIENQVHYIEDFTHADVALIMKQQLVLDADSLKEACRWLGIPAKDNPIIPVVWRRASVGSEVDLAYVFRHNIEDVLSTEEVSLAVLNSLGYDMFFWRD